MARIELSESEILDTLRDARKARRPDPPGQLVVISELVAKSGRSDRTIRDQMRELLRQGRVEVVHVQRERCDGKMTTVPAYRFKQVPKKARR